MSDSATPWTAACKPSLSSTISKSLLKFISIELVMLPNLVLCHLLLLLPSIFPSIRVFSNESALWIRWPKYLSFSFSISPSYEYSGLTSLRIDWFDLLAVQGTLKSSLAPQYESINFSALSLLYGPTLTYVHDYWKTHNFDYMDLCGKVMSLLFNTLSCHSFSSKKQVYSNFMAELTIQWFWSTRKENLLLLPHFPLLFAKKWWDWMPWS